MILVMNSDARNVTLADREKGNDVFRKEVRGWLQEHCPMSMRTDMPDHEIVWGGRKQRWFSEDAKVWLERMAERGWTTVPHWPTAYGGAGLDAGCVKMLNEEMQRINARVPLQSFGMWMLGPALLEFASEEHKQHYLPQIARGEIRWCQVIQNPVTARIWRACKRLRKTAETIFLVNGAKDLDILCGPIGLDFFVW